MTTPSASSVEPFLVAPTAECRRRGRSRVGRTGVGRCCSPSCGAKKCAGSRCTAKPGERRSCRRNAWPNCCSRDNPALASLAASRPPGPIQSRLMGQNPRSLAHPIGKSSDPCIFFRGAFAVAGGPSPPDLRVGRSRQTSGSASSTLKGGPSFSSPRSRAAASSPIASRLQTVARIETAHCKIAMVCNGLQWRPAIKRWRLLSNTPPAFKLGAGLFTTTFLAHCNLQRKNSRPLAHDNAFLQRRFSQPAVFRRRNWPRTIFGMVLSRIP